MKECLVSFLSIILFTFFFVLISLLFGLGLRRVMLIYLQSGCLKCFSSVYMQFKDIQNPIYMWGFRLFIWFISKVFRFLSHAFVFVKSPTGVILSKFRQCILYFPSLSGLPAQALTLLIADIMNLVSVTFLLLLFVFWVNV